MNLQDMPEDGLAAYRHQGLGPVLAFFLQPHAVAAAKDNGFHSL